MTGSWGILTGNGVRVPLHPVFSTLSLQGHTKKRLSRQTNPGCRDYEVSWWPFVQVRENLEPEIGRPTYFSGFP